MIKIQVNFHVSYTIFLKEIVRKIAKHTEKYNKVYI